MYETLVHIAIFIAGFSVGEWYATSYRKSEKEIAQDKEKDRLERRVGDESQRHSEMG